MSKLPVSPPLSATSIFQSDSTGRLNLSLRRGAIFWKRSYPSLRQFGSVHAWFLVAVIGIPIATIVLLNNPYDPPGAIDAFFYRAYALRFTDLINRYGPYYYSYRLAHIGWGYLFERLFGGHIGYLIWKITQLSLIAACVWWILKPLTSPKVACCLIALLLTSPWLINGVVTYHYNGSSLIYTFATIAFLSALSRHEFKSLPLSLMAGSAYALLENTNLSLIVFGGLLFVGYYATALEPGRIRQLLVSLAAAIGGFIGTQIVILVAWSAILIFRSGTPLSAIYDWIIESVTMQGWRADMFGLFIGRAATQQPYPYPAPSVEALLRGGNIHIIAPPLILAAAVLFRVWSRRSMPAAEVDHYRSAQRIFDPILVAAVLIIGYVYTGSDYTSNSTLNLSYYFVNILPITFLVSFAHISLALRAVRGNLGENVSAVTANARLVILIAALVPAAFILNNLVPLAMMDFFTAKLVVVTLAGLAAVTALAASLPIISPRLASVAAVLVVVNGSMLFLSSSGYGSQYRAPFSPIYAELCADLMAAQSRLSGFVAKSAPPAGVMPHGHPILNWHPNSPFTVSLSANFLADHYTLHIGHGGVGLPKLDDRAMNLLRGGIYRDIVLTYLTEEQGNAAHQALHAAGVTYELLDQMKYEGRAQSVFFDYIRIVKSAEK